MSFVSHAQIVAKLYYSRAWELTTRDSSAYFRVSVFDTTQRVFAGEVKDYTRDGKLVMKGAYKGGKREGEFTFYFENGNTQMVGSFAGGLRSGNWRYFYQDGKQMSEIQFIDDNIANIFYCYDSTGRKVLENNSGILIEEYEEPGFKQLVVNRGEIKNLMKIGEWTCHLKDGQWVYREKYNKAGFVSGRGSKLMGKAGQYYGPVNNHFILHFKFPVTERYAVASGMSLDLYPFLKPKIRPTTFKRTYTDSITGEIFTVVEQSATPPGGMAAFYRFIGEHVQYPATARKMRIQGRVFVEFIIYQDGTLGDFAVVRGIGGGCDEEAIRVLRAYGLENKWIPGSQKGKPVKQRYTLPIIFKLG